MRIQVILALAVINLLENVKGWLQQQLRCYIRSSSSSSSRKQQQ
jgi:hypothetical protein